MYLDIFIYTYIYPAIATPPAILHMVNVDCRTRTGEPYWWNPLKFMRVLMAMRNSELAGFMWTWALLDFPGLGRHIHGNPHLGWRKPIEKGINMYQPYALTQRVEIQSRSESFRTSVQRVSFHRCPCPICGCPHQCKFTSTKLYHPSVNSSGVYLQIAFLHHILLQTAKPWNIGKVGAGNAICPNPQTKNAYTIFNNLIFCI